MNNTAKRNLLIVLSAGLIAFTGCGGEKKEQQKTAGEPAPQTAAPAPAAQQAAPQAAMPAGHPAADAGAAVGMTKAAHSSIKTQKEVRLSKEVAAKWNEVKLDIVDAAGKTKDTLTLKVGSTTPLKRPGFKLRVEAFVPDYVIVENHIESRSNEPKNPAVLVELTEGGKSVARGWVFKALPDFNSYTDSRFQVSLVGPWAGDKK
ncbi:MAG: hypothetical protein HY894_07745 [Deltaproteobacteria bacterium]|nr:hypothetical protein [Deltaproteobacteria bacterium]